jgi:endoglucanase
MDWDPRFERRVAERRTPPSDVLLAPGGRERRRGIDRRRTAAVLLAGTVAALALPAPASAQATTGSSPLRTARFFVDPASPARQQVNAWRNSRPGDAAQLEKIAAGSQADWFGDWNADVLSAVHQRVSTISASGATAVLVAYNIPNRDCGQYSAGGAGGAAAYRDWIRRFALGIGSRRAVVILEPDALGHLSSCGTAAQQQERLVLLHDAVQVLKANPATVVYIDAGNSRWLSVADAAARLNAAGVAYADGFALNVSNFNATVNEVSYGNAISARVGGRHYVVDTSRNGRGPASTWCNPGGQALGAPASGDTGNALVDAWLWVKRPGESDGTCNGGPAAGTWWGDYALGLAKRASF